MYYSFEHREEHLAVLVGDNDQEIAVELSLLPPDARPGDMFVLEGGRYVRDTKERDRRRARIQAKERLLRGE